MLPLPLPPPPPLPLPLPLPLSLSLPLQLPLLRLPLEALCSHSGFHFLVIHRPANLTPLPRGHNSCIIFSPRRVDYACSTCHFAPQPLLGSFTCGILVNLNLF